MTAAEKLLESEPRLVSGYVERVGKALEVRLATGVYPARRAKSCLVAPEAGDRVLCAVEADATYVLAVLDGREGAGTRVVADGDLRLQARGGRASVSATDGVDLVSGADVSVTGADLHVRAKKGSVALEDLGFVGRVLRADVGKIALLAREVDSICTRLSTRAKRIFRFVEDLEQTRAGTVDVRAETLLGLRAENAVISSRVLTKVDGEQIHIG